jgi:transcription-repair coupling factor (superfamily II helicase)
LKDKSKNIIQAILEASAKHLDLMIEKGNYPYFLRLPENSFRSLVLAGVSVINKRPVLIISDDNRSEDWVSDLEILLGQERVINLTEPKKSVHIKHYDEHQSISWLIEGITKLNTDNSRVIVSSPSAFNYSLPKPDDVNSQRITIRKGDSIDFQDFYKNLCLSGFDRKDYVDGVGDIAIRGGIIDFFPISWENPVRVEFWGNEIDSIREFDPISQRSILDHESISFLSSTFPGTEPEDSVSLLSYIPEDTLLIVDDYESAEFNELIEGALSSFDKIYINKIGSSQIAFPAENQPRTSGSVKSLVEELRKLNKLNFRLIITADGDIHLSRLKELFENSTEIILDDIVDESERSAIISLREDIFWLNKSFSKGFVSFETKTAIFTEHEIFDRVRIRSEKRRKVSKGISLKELRQLQIGDYVVHEDKGVGKFEGLEKITLGGSLQDCIKLTYADKDVLYVHLNYIHKIQKYSAEEGVKPQVSKLGSTEWLRKKNRAKKKLKDIARELIILYSQRKSQQGYPYPADTMWQKEFEASFIYEDTIDQAKTTQEIKVDMEQEIPMDRLVCGDVGYGKTEIAIRAAFKAVQAGKQVAILVPTTILSQQHYMTIRDRLSKYPVIIEVLSRFKSPKEQKEIIQKVKDGAVDILVGTHRILSKDIIFKDLGLLIIDEEHRFGVGAKEKLRQMKVNIDTLTLTATPIPRTLNFSLLGARDLSVIETPPRNRIPVYTEICPWDDRTLTEAIENELNRKGQIFFVNDKIEDLDRLAAKLVQLMPHIRYGIAHGQMPGEQLEGVMEKFIKGKFDILIATKIVESGLDIPNANTMIINNSDNFGLAELYQLRGRVGRSNKQAYCYLLIPELYKLSRKALQRLQAIEEFTDLGSGFQLALRDLEIRGAGNLLGAEQSGYINEMGFELFQKIIDEAVRELKYDEFHELFKDTAFDSHSVLNNEDIEIEIDQDALLPDDYVSSETERFSYYKKLYALRTNDELDNIRKELTDRYGKLPQQASELFFAVKLRLSALNTGLRKIILKSESMIGELPAEDNVHFYERAFPVLMEYLGEIPESRLINKGKKLMLQFNISGRDSAIEILWKIQKMLEMAEL